jgi:hypothetical protein
MEEETVHLMMDMKQNERKGPCVTFKAYPSVTYFL